MSRLVVVSNRVAVPSKSSGGAGGGLAVALKAALKESGGIWFGWSGEVADQPATEPDIKRSDSITYATLDLTPDDRASYYNGFSNSTLWPLFHYRLDLTDFTRQTYGGYMRVNGMFAARLLPMLDPADRIWVHDYHLMPFAEHLRNMGVQARMGFFLHTPFPVPEVLTALPNHETLLRSMCAYDLIGFQTRTDREAFVGYLVREAHGERLGDDLIRAYGRTLKAGVYPISVETAEIARVAAEAYRSRHSERMRESLVDKQLIIGVDRLDYSKGLVKRFEAFENLLEHYVDNRGRVVFMQIAPPSREDVKEYIEIRQELEAKAGHINGAYADFDWMPIRYLNKGFSRRNLLGFYRTAEIGLVTPLRDGMNLVAKEYVAAQDPEAPGVLILSRFAGAAEELATGALIVNPYDVEAVAQALQRALTMPLEERRQRHEAMMAVLGSNDIRHWWRRFTEDLTAAPFADDDPTGRPAA